MRCAQEPKPTKLCVQPVFLLKRSLSAFAPVAAGPVAVKSLIGGRAAAGKERLQPAKDTDLPAGVLWGCKHNVFSAL